MTVGPDYRLPEDSQFAKVQKKSPRFDPRGSAAVDVSKEAVEGDWWTLYDDSLLNSLISQALAANVNLKIAGARLAQAQARSEQIAALGGVHGNVSASVTRGRVSAESLLQAEPLPVSNFATGSLTVSYQLDLFGKIRRGVEAAEAGVEAVQAAQDIARISVAAAVAGAYVEICHGSRELAVARHSLDLQERSRDVASRLYQAGRGAMIAVERAEAQVAILRSTIPPLQARRQAAGYELAELLGRTPDQAPPEAIACQTPPELKHPIPVGDGAALLRRRPDVRQAERALAAATAEIGVATAEMYPEIHLGISVGATGLLEDFANRLTREFMFGPLISWTIPDSGARARVREASARAAMALAEFDLVVLRALRETQTILNTYAEDLRHVEALREARDRARTAAEDIRRLYISGREPYLSSLDGDRTLASAEAALATAESQVSRDQIRLFLALGGGWHSASPAASPASSLHAGAGSRP
jgi:NodT family efflux transporter outer membrane factor (OMF) lipoprotein